MQAELARAQVKHRGPGGDRKSEEYRIKHKQLMNDRPKLKPGETSAYLLRRIERKRPDVLKRYEAGEFKSVKAAAREAGIVKQPKPFDQVRKLIQKLTPEERAKLKSML